MNSPLAMISASNTSTRMICLALAAGVVALHLLLAQQLGTVGYMLELWFAACAIILLLRKPPTVCVQDNSDPDQCVEDSEHLVPHLTDLIWRINFSSRSVCQLNQVFTEIHPQANAENKKISVLFPARISRQYLEALISVQSTQKAQTFEYLHSGNDQVKRYFEARILPLSARDCIAVIRDITYIKDTEQALLSQQIFVQQIIDSSPNLIFVRDKHCRFLLVNRATQIQLGHELLVQSHMGLVDSPQPFTKGDDEVLETGETIRHLDSWLMPDNQLHWFDITKLPIVRNENTYILYIAMDISHLKSAEAAMEHIHSLIRSVADVLPLSFVLIEDGLITFANQEAARLLNQDNTALTGQTLANAMGQEISLDQCQMIDIPDTTNQLVIFK